MSKTDANSFTSPHPPQTPLLIPLLLGNSRPRHTLLPPTLRMSTLHSPLGTTPGMQTKNQSPKQKGFASYLPLSPTPLLQKRLGTIPPYEHNSHAGNGAKDSAGRGEIGEKQRAQRPRRPILPFSLTPRARNWDHPSPNLTTGVGIGIGEGTVVPSVCVKVMTGKGGDTTSSILDVKEEGEGRMRCKRYERDEESEGGNKTWNGKLNSTEHNYPSFHSPCPSVHLSICPSAHLPILPNPTASLHPPPITKTTTILPPIHLLPPAP
ncbi:hypothetical protein I311_00846 [Cryptococcus gattii NT-10]|nr:hypothetical protein I311_00846 [Cryptococcus gattii NT-10]